MVVISTFHPRERVAQNDAVIDTIYRNLGDVAAEAMVSRALAEVSLQLLQLAGLVRSRNLAELPRQMQKLRVLADGLGLVSVAEVAMDLRSCLLCGDSTGFAAVWARLIRVADRSLGLDLRLIDASGAPPSRCGD